jgi:hypothetical protein
MQALGQTAIGPRIGHACLLGRKTCCKVYTSLVLVIHAADKDLKFNVSGIRL